MAQVTIYTKPYCPFCSRALSLLQQKGVQIDEIEASSDMARRQEMIQKSGRSTYPQIFVGDHHIGGCDDLVALDRNGELDPLLSA